MRARICVRHVGGLEGWIYRNYHVVGKVIIPLMSVLAGPRLMVLVDTEITESLTQRMA